VHAISLEDLSFKAMRVAYSLSLLNFLLAVLPWKSTGSYQRMSVIKRYTNENLSEKSGSQAENAIKDLID
jgi:hypothetical protein